MTATSAPGTASRSASAKTFPGRAQIAASMNRGVEGHAERRCLELMNALERRRHRLNDNRVGGDGSSFVLRWHRQFGRGDAVRSYRILLGADVARCEELESRDASG